MPELAIRGARRRRSRARGFSLVEVVVALALLGILLLSGATLYALEVRSLRGLAAHRAAESALAAAYESLRAGQIALSGSGVAWRYAGGSLSIIATPEDLPGLYRVTLIATYDAAGRPSRRSRDVLLYRP